MVKMFKPKSLSDAYHLARFQETTINLMKRMTNPLVLHTSHVKDSSEIVNINISLNDLSEFSNEGDEDDKIASIDSNEVESNGLEKNCSSDLGIENGCDGSTLMEMTTVVTKIKVSVTNFQYNKAYHIMENQDSKKDDGVKWNDKVSDLVNFANGVAGLKMD
ncbi:hypothetical protein Tco_1157932 [Tanacetum coccineum]